MLLIADSGSTKTDWCLVGKDGSVRSFSTQGINPYHQNDEMIAHVLRQELLPQMGLKEQSLRVCFYGSGVRTDKEEGIRKLLATCIPHTEDVEAHGDLLGAARALCGREVGVACILGTGSNSCLYDGQSIVANTPALGYVLGDEGSGAVLGIRFLNGLLKGQLSAQMKSELLSREGWSMDEIIDRVYRQPLANRFLASLAPFIHEHLEEDGVEALVINNFRDFIKRNIQPYFTGHERCEIHAVGSMAFHYESQLRAAAALEGVRIGKILKSPMQGLIDYHLQTI